MKKKIMIIVSLVILLILLFPTRHQLKDGGSVQYKALTYEIIKVHSLISEDEMNKEGTVKPYIHGYIIKILGIEVYNNVQ